ncbi:MAG: hypothetical protein ACE5H5_05790 [Nitrospinota bacterium]
MRPGKTKLFILTLVATFVVFGVVCGGLAVGDADAHEAHTEHPCFFFTVAETGRIAPLLPETVSMGSWLVVPLLVVSLASPSAEARRRTLQSIPLKILPLQRRLALLQTLLH